MALAKGNKKQLLPFFLLVVLIPLVHVPFFNASVFSAPKLLIFRLVLLAVLGMWGFLVFVSGEIKIRKNWLNVLLLTLGVVGILTTLFSDYFWTSVLGIDGRFIGLSTVLGLCFLSFFVFNSFCNWKDVRSILKLSFFVAVVTAGYGVLQHQLWFDELTHEFFKWGISPLNRAFSTFGHSTHFAAYLAMHLPIGLFFLTGRAVDNNSVASKKFRLFSGIGIILIAWAILATGSRGGLGAALIILLIIGIRHLVLNWKKKSDHLLRVVVGTLATVFLISSLWMGFSGKISNLQTVKRTKAMLELWNEGKVTDRQSWWLSSLDMWKDSPILGHGLSTYADLYNQYRRLDYRVPEDAQDYIVPHNAHMEFFNILATQGVLGLLAYLSLLGYVSFCGLRFLRIKGKKEEKELVFFLMMGVLAYLLHSLLSFGVISSLTFVYLFLGLIMGIVGEKNWRVWKLEEFGKTVGVLVTLLVVVGGMFSIRLYAADIFKQKGEKADFGENEQFYKIAILLNPYEYSYLLDFGDLLLQKGQISEDVSFAQNKIREALNYLQKTLEINAAHPVVYNHIAIAYSELSKLALENGDSQNFDVYVKKAITNHKIAADKSPNNPMYLYDLASFLYRNGMKKEAYSYFEEVSRIRPGFKAVDERVKEIREGF